MSRAISASLVALFLAACGGGGGDDPAPAPAPAPVEAPAPAPEPPPAPPPPPVASCASEPIGTERWPAWNPGDKHATEIARLVLAYKAEVQNWKIYYQPGGYEPAGEYVTIQGFAVLGPDTMLDADGVPLVLHRGEWVYNPTTLANFALYHHTMYLRGAALSPGFWAAANKLRSMQGPDGALRYTYEFEGMPPGWVSAMAQGQALSVYSRAYRLSGDQGYIDAGNAALQFMLKPVEDGGLRGSMKDLDPSLERYVSLYEYSKDVSPHTLNGFVFTAFGLFDWAKLGEAAPTKGVESGLADEYFKCSAHTIASTIHYYDIGGYSAYDMRQALGMGEPSAGTVYHKLHIALAVALHSVTQRPELLQWAKVWADAVDQPVP